MMALEFDTDPTFSPGTVTTPFACNFVGATGNRRMAVSPDGQRFLLLADATWGTDSDAARSRLIGVQNFFEELRRLVPTD
jgi:hypothetical protein